jgi:lipopolysaccharide export system protein LptA
VLTDARVQEPSGSFSAPEVTVQLRNDNSIEQVLATGGVEISTTGGEAISARAPQAAFAFGPRSEILSATLHGGVKLQGSGASPVNGSAERIVAEFEDARLERIRAQNNVSFRQAEGADSSELRADAVTFFMRGGRALDRAETAGRSEIVIGQANAQTRTVATADRFTMRFDPRGRLRALHGEPNARITSKTGNQPERVSTSRQLDVAFTARGAIENVAQVGDVEFKDGQRTATAERARYTPNDAVLTLSGSPRVNDQGFEIAATTIRIDTDGSSATAEGNVKSTYTQVKAQAGGAMFAASEPIHVTAGTMTARRTPALARYSGGVRMWQGASVLQAPQIEFDYEKRGLTAQGSGNAPVSTVFMQPAEKGALRPVNVTAERLTYSDQQRLARFSGGVTVRGADATITAPTLDVHLAAQGQPTPTPQASQVERIVASGGVAIQQASRRATGERLTYTAAEGKFVLTGGPPRIDDAELGSITGDSLTFYTRDGKVQVASGTSSRTVTTTRVRQ